MRWDGHVTRMMELRVLIRKPQVGDNKKLSSGMGCEYVNWIERKQFLDRPSCCQHILLSRDTLANFVCAGATDVAAVRNLRRRMRK